MKKVEVLSPVGDVDSFFMAVKSGCDAVYMGLPKFNARMRAQNITLENLPALVEFAHLKDVKVYITLNTLLSNSEIVDAVGLVAQCLMSHVDAFIVQDLGLIYVLKRCFPGIVLHGSTQLGVHNVRGAMVAKKLGLSRIVLSREVTLRDIREIANKVDIELEVFVQGANCICFSGNCYLSSLKCGASGNRGECKQLCRLPYTLSSGSKVLKGYALSPRDNCMLGSLKDLIDSGVVSLKIEGRLRHLGYVGIATNVYRHAVDTITMGSDLHDLSAREIDEYTNALKKVFARGEYTRGYFDSNNIIDAKNNNHMGECIGKVVSCKPFKDIYKIAIDTRKQLHQGDGLKFESNNGIISLGVGNIDIIDGKQVVFGKNHINIGSSVYIALDTEFEKSIEDLSKYLNLKIDVRAIAGKPICVRYACGDSVFDYTGGVLECAKTKAVTKQNIIDQLGKVDKEIFGEIVYDIETDNAFVSLSTLNDIRRRAVEYLKRDILDKYNKSNNLVDFGGGLIEKVCNADYIKNLISTTSRSIAYDRLAFVGEKTNIQKCKSDYDSLILDPENFGLDVILKFLNEYKKLFDAPLIINLPTIARVDDLKVIEDVIDKLQSEDVIFVANNIYALSFDKVKLWAGYGLNIVNDYSASLCMDLGVSEIISSVEKWCNRLSDTYKLGFCPSLMTLTSCPVKLLYSSDCSNCKYNDKIFYEGTVGKFRVRRIKIANCYFQLVEDRPCKNGIIDLR